MKICSLTAVLVHLKKIQNKALPTHPSGRTAVYYKCDFQIQKKMWNSLKIWPKKPSLLHRVTKTSNCTMQCGTIPRTAVPAAGVQGQLNYWKCTNKTLIHVLLENTIRNAIPKVKINALVQKTMKDHACIKGKQTRLTITPNNMKKLSQNKLDLMHTYLFDPMDGDSLSGTKHIFIFIDNHLITVQSVCVGTL